MADENSRSNPVSSLLGYKSLDDNQQNEIREQHINPAFEDNEIPYIPSLNGNSLAYSLEIPNPRMNKCTENGAYIESYLSPPIPPYFDGHAKESNISIMSNQFTNDLGLKGIPKLPNGLHEEDSGSTKEKKEKDSDDDSVTPTSFLTLFRYSSSIDKILIFFGCVIAMLSGAALPTIMVLFGNILDAFVDHHRMQKNLTSFDPTDSNLISKEDFLSQVANMCLYITIIGCIVFCFNYLMVSFFSMAAANQAFKIRCMFMKSVLRQDIGWFDTHQTGDFASRLTGDLSRIQDGIGEKVGMCISFLCTTIFCVCTALYYGWKLTLVCLCIMPILSIAMGIISKIQAAVSGDELQAYGAAGAVAEEVLSSIRTVAAFGGEKKEIERYNNCLIPASKKGIKRGLLTSIGAGLIWFCIYAGYALAFWYGVKLIVDGKDQEVPEYKPSTLVIVFFNVMLGAMGVGQTAPYFEAFALARGAASKVFSIIERKPPIDSSSESGKVLQYLEGNITLKDVHFNYPARPDVPILRGFSLKIKSGETVALVGPSGCGKSTIVQLIQRFYDADRGSVEIDGVDVRDLNVGWLRDNIGLVGQEPVLFSTTIAENICYGKSGATQEDVEKAAKLANVHSFIDALPLKYNTLVGERGTQLSGGQKQRIAIARALIKNPKILLLDEATSALDTESEAIVQSALDQARQGRTTIIVAHRLSTIRTADKIIALSNGVIAEVGTHDELMEKKGVYYELVMTQTKSAEEEEDEEEDDILDEDLPMLERQMSILSSASYNSEDTLPRNARRTFSAASHRSKKAAMEEEEEDEKAAPSQTRLIKMCAPEWPYILVGSIAALIMGIFTPVYGIVFGDILGILAEQSETILNDISYYSLVFLAMAVSAGIACFLQTFMFSVAGEKLTSRLRKMVFTTIISQDISWFDDPKNGVGSLCTRLTSDASSVQGATGSRISTALQALSTLIAAIVIGLWFNYKIGIVVLCFVPLVLLATYFESRVISGHMLSEKSGTEQASKVAIEAIDSIRTVASLHKEEAFYIQFRNALFGPHKKSRKNSQIRGVTFGFAQSIPSFAYACSMYYGSVLVAEGELSYPDLFKVIEAVILGTAMVGQAVAFAPDYQKAKVAAVRIFKLLDIKPSIDIFSTAGRVLDDVKGYIRFKNVRFNYPSRPRVKILRGLNLEIEPGQTVALVGSSGCGKSTCIQLLERFYDAQQGDVMLDDACVKDMNISNLRSHIGLVSQEPVLFSCSLAENIAYGDNSRKVEMHEIIAAARQANIHNFIASLPQGYDTPVGDKGAQLSGGQKQRIAIARALLRNPKILLLDEATSALDAESEKVVQEALDKASSGRTCLVIAHRLSTIQNADTIIVISRGRVVEKGTHQELLNKKGLYYNLHNTQAGTR
ncbi:ATP-dependent translocase ABCB1-like isoform X2 [Stegodyphus dumicola]|nr:ATP-dependent translocase ABCB1-like isoform X2 [Stegodyphus dumicola]XP_035227145.1 ATP-dependent translocase ABCB1-like isoform X2 [Stegodyphus dumicola]XP_035227147.1 ATP-dependent translocase ABCB1-like isoform X2 [Stegodyphus dumicola]XP_035227148.1 ATP-dependent translocase ABCB1-like isoform X2 [Stegodyphus dumicola]